MANIAIELAELLGTVVRPGDFFFSGTTDFPAPRFEVEGVGQVAFPLLQTQAEQLIAIAKRAPYGRGADTVVDTDVRRTWQINADQVRIGGKHWARTLDGIVGRVAEGLGVGEPVSAELYKLLIYDQGSFFVGHRDTEKSPGMFATLILALPSVSAGGELIVRHKGREATLDLRCDEPSEIGFAAFFADCVHEVLPVTSGCRATLVYNLVRKGKAKRLEPPSYEGELARATALLQKWATAQPSVSGDGPQKLIYPLEHAYTPAELGFGKLKGPDAAVASLLTTAAPAASCELHLALISIEESGAAEYTGDYRSWRRRGDDDEEFEAGEVFNRSEVLCEWRRPDGAPATMGELPIEATELSPPDALADMEPDEEHFHEATGNEGASFDRTYRRAALVLWPSARIFAVLNQAGLSATLPYLEALVHRWDASGAKKPSPLRKDALELAGHMLSTWPARPWYASADTRPSEWAHMFMLLARLGDKEGVEDLITKLIAQGGHGNGDNAAILTALETFTPGQAADALSCIVAANAAQALGACGGLLAQAVKTRFKATPAQLAGAVKVLVEALPGDPAHAPKETHWRGDTSAVDAEFVANVVQMVDLVDKALATRAADHLLAWPKTYELDAVLVPAVRTLIGAKTQKAGIAFERLRAACVTHLRDRAALPLEPPRDWTRDSELSCHCTHCVALSRFLADPQRETWTLKAAAPIRGHVEDSIKKARCDVSHTTERRGSPHGLVCTKTQASYARRVKQRKQDLADLELLKM